MERPRIKLLPRTEGRNEPTRKSDIFGGAKPRDEHEYRERKLSEEIELRKSLGEEVDESTIVLEDEKPKHYTRRRDSKSKGRKGSKPSPQQGGRKPRVEMSDEELVKRHTVKQTSTVTSLSNAFGALGDSDSD